MYNNGIQGYRRTNVTTASPKKLVLMCYEGAIDQLKITKQMMAEQDYEGKVKAITKAQDIIKELLCSLDYEKGGDIATNLGSLYNYMLRRIIHADVKSDQNAIDEVVGMLSELKSAWEEIFNRQSKKIAPETAPVMEKRNRQVSNYAP